MQKVREIGILCDDDESVLLSVFPDSQIIRFGEIEQSHLVGIRENVGQMPAELEAEV
jgi:hypothetical protein